ncbi:SIN3-HDAC complex-associated factor isoform X1 [Phymastichus coffea]|uniref:SIN3-HDAC complex-associated factor isoform X1 n=1 Tax=Phymastichus coffea TaxID=108790 RepID=UPI00273AB8A6|nr:SIN3-HDAC complex-associated factor isoform X1 [Phymastichus coffea]XP_058793107.1 SIN3-HDAC complex-associated factor isoform X1 [Phymastichus coffea]XP_058793108.1 SIN3-HDAC complex-associated factor isoform X1 [Phymastichus coffea]
MFSFHKPKVYRSSTGCCICKAKSSSSRFTDSKKYEEDFIKCFLLEERRTGEICNACVLLVKRWKKLPVGSDRNWRHVVDARAGPGIKSLTKFKAKNKKAKIAKVEKFDKIQKKKHVYVKGDRDREHSPTTSDDTGSSRANTPDSCDDNGIGDKSQDMDQGEMEISSFIDLTYFKRKNVCCGVVFVGMRNELLIEPSLFKRCHGCLERERQRATAAVTMMGSSPSHSSASASPCHSSASTSPAYSVESNNETAVKAKGFCDSSSDSGYDDSSQGMITEGKKMIVEQPPSIEQAMPLVAKSDKPLGTVQIPSTDKIVPMSTTLRLKANAVGSKVPIKLLCKPVALVSSAKLSLSNASTAIPPTAAVDFAMHSPTQQMAN